MVDGDDDGSSLINVVGKALGIILSEGRLLGVEEKSWHSVSHVARHTSVTLSVLSVGFLVGSGHRSFRSSATHRQDLLGSLSKLKSGSSKQNRLGSKLESALGR